MPNLNIVAEGGSLDEEALSRADAKLPNGAYAELRLFVASPPSAQDLAVFQSQLVNEGMLLWDKVCYDSGIIVIRYVKQSPPESNQVGIVWFIPAIAFGVLAIGASVFGWQLASNTGSLLSNPLLIVGAIGLIVVFFILKPSNSNAPAPQQEGY